MEANAMDDINKKKQLEMREQKDEDRIWSQIRGPEGKEEYNRGERKNQERKKNQERESPKTKIQETDAQM